MLPAVAGRIAQCQSRYSSLARVPIGRTAHLSKPDATLYHRGPQWTLKPRRCCSTRCRCSLSRRCTSPSARHVAATRAPARTRVRRRWSGRRIAGVSILFTQEPLAGNALVSLVAIVLAAIPAVLAVRARRRRLARSTGCSTRGRAARAPVARREAEAIAVVLLDELAGVFELDLATLALVEDGGRRARSSRRAKAVTTASGSSVRSSTSSASRPASAPRRAKPRRSRSSTRRAPPSSASG